MAKITFSISMLMTVLTAVACSDSVAPVNAGVPGEPRVLEFIKENSE